MDLSRGRRWGHHLFRHVSILGATMLHMLRPGNWTRPAGESPARVSARAPGSRPRLDGFLVKRHGRNLRPGRAKRWMEDWFNSHGLYRLRGTIRYPEAA